jgi:hypothetical protein
MCNSPTELHPKRIINLQITGISSFNPLPPIKHDLNCADFYETHNNPINVCGNLLYEILRALIYNV